MLDLLWSPQLNTATKSKGWYNLSCRCMLTHNIPQLTHGLHHNTSNASPVPVSQPLVRYCPNTLEDVFFDAEEAPSEILKCWILYTRFWTWTLHNLILVSGWAFLNAISKKVISCDIQSNQMMRWGDPHQGQSTAKYMTDHDWIPESIYILLLYGSLSKRRPIIQYMGVMPYTIHILWHWGDTLDPNPRHWHIFCRFAGRRFSFKGHACGQPVSATTKPSSGLGNSSWSCFWPNTYILEQ